MRRFGDIDFLVDMTERATATFAQAFLAVWIVGGPSLEELFALDALKVATAAGLLAVAKAVVAMLATQTGEPPA